MRNLFFVMLIGCSKATVPVVAPVADAANEAAALPVDATEVLMADAVSPADAPSAVTP